MKSQQRKRIAKPIVPAALERRRGRDLARGVHDRRGRRRLGGGQGRGWRRRGLGRRGRRGVAQPQEERGSTRDGGHGHRRSIGAELEGPLELALGVEDLDAGGFGHVDNGAFVARGQDEDLLASRGKRGGGLAVHFPELGCPGHDDRGRHRRDRDRSTRQRHGPGRRERRQVDEEQGVGISSGNGDAAFVAVDRQRDDLARHGGLAHRFGAGIDDLEPVGARLRDGDSGLASVARQDVPRPGKLGTLIRLAAVDCHESEGPALRHGRHQNLTGRECQGRDRARDRQGCLNVEGLDVDRGDLGARGAGEQCQAIRAEGHRLRRGSNRNRAHDGGRRDMDLEHARGARDVEIPYSVRQCGARGDEDRQQRRERRARRQKLSDLHATTCVNL